MSLTAKLAGPHNSRDEAASLHFDGKITVKQNVTLRYETNFWKEV